MKNHGKRLKTMLQENEGDLAIYLTKSGFEIELNKEKYIILPHS